MWTSAALLILAWTPCLLGAARPALRFCSGSVCAGYGAPLVLEAAQGLSCDPACEVTVATATCMKACNKVPLDGMAVFVNGEQQLLPEATDGAASLRIAFEALGQPKALEATRQAMGRKLAGDAAMQGGDVGTAVAEYSAAISGAPRGMLEREAAAASDAASTDGSQPPGTPPSLAGLGPSRLAVALAKERERTMPGRVRWLYGALVGRSRGYLATGGGASAALQDARDATRLCPLAPASWWQLREAAAASGDAALAAQAEEAARRLAPRGMADEEARLLLAVTAPPPPPRDETVAAPKKDTRSRALLAYGLAISGIIGAIAYRKTPGNGVGE